MATARLSDYDKGRIANNFDATLNRVMNNKIFPIEDVAMNDWGVRQIPKHIREPYKYLLEHADYLVRGDSYNSTFYIASHTHRYEVSHYATWPCKNITIRETDPLHKDVLTYVEWYYDATRKVNAASSYQYKAVHACTSAGQITRIFPPEVIRFLPTRISESLGEAERKSRIPKGFTLVEHELENLMQMLALGSISPEDLTGLNIHVSSRKEIAEKE